MNEESYAALIRGAVLFLPLGLFLLGLRFRALTERVRGGLWLSFLWNLQALFLLNLLAVHFGWWRYDVQGGALYGVPVDFLIGWTLLWGPVPLLLGPRVSLPIIALILLYLDILFMSRLEPLLILGDHWLAGEGLLLLVAFLPGQLLARWTRDDRALAGRVILQIAGFGGLMLILIPAAAMAVTDDTSSIALGSLPWWQRALLFSAIAWPGVVGLSAVQEFYSVGRGTPIPYDSPKRLVVSGVYRYVANPMQVSYLLLLIVAAYVCTSYAILSGTLVVLAYGSGFAAWHEGTALEARFGAPWTNYRARVRYWIPRITPALDAPANLYVAADCDVCRQTGRFLEKLGGRGITIRAAETYPGETLTRITYECDGVRDTGVTAVARALENTNLFLALLGFVMRLPGISHTLQLIMDIVLGFPGAAKESQTET